MTVGFSFVSMLSATSFVICVCFFVNHMGIYINKSQRGVNFFAVPEFS